MLCSWLRACRYSTDPRWHVPHFEKMLYDQSQLITAYVEAFQVIFREWILSCHHPCAPSVLPSGGVLVNCKGTSTIAYIANVSCTGKKASRWR